MAANGTPIWVDISVADLDRSQSFYRSLLGWDYTPSVPELGGYCNALVDGEVVAGLSPVMDPASLPPGVDNSLDGIWTIHLAADDIDAVSARVDEAGGTTVLPRMDVSSFGSMSLHHDPQGNVFGLWQSGEHTGFDTRTADGAPCWIDLMTSDYPAAKDFYAALFGYQYQEVGFDGMQYSIVTVDGDETALGGIGQGGQDIDGWNVAFGVADVDASVASVPELGGTVIEQPFDFQFGRCGVVAGPDGEVFTLFQDTGGTDATA